MKGIDTFLKISILVLINLLLSSAVCSQSCAPPIPPNCSELLKLIKPSVVLLGYKPNVKNINTIKTEIKYCSNCLTDSLNNEELSKLYYVIANLRFYLDINDSKVVENLVKSFYHDSGYFCENYSTYSYNGHLKEFELHFIDQLNNPVVKGLVEKCLSSENSNSLKNNNQSNTGVENELPQIYEIIRSRDQLYRRSDGILNDTAQFQMDLINRNSLDSLFTLSIENNETLINNQNFFVLWLVLQHSLDCKWNNKWFIRLLDSMKADNDNLEYVDLIKGVYERFYVSDTLCQLPENTTYWDLITKYPFLKEDQNQISNSLSDNEIICDENFEIPVITIYMKSSPPKRVELLQLLECHNRIMSTAINLNVRNNVLNSIAHDYYYLGKRDECLNTLDEIYSSDKNYIKNLFDKYAIPFPSESPLENFYLLHLKKDLIERGYLE